jgi:hypothetical protein
MARLQDVRHFSPKLHVSLTERRRCGIVPLSVAGLAAPAASGVRPAHLQSR